ncbi:AbiTii domain-containing protein [Phaeobacter piscinae]|uniref:AbiTii domain-containing protein n=1 Tax=Phaeobacter piscinae TaxID=1580596 RepID=UPI00059053AE|nr:hypothetical protein [Phaeobacter piscinae]UTS81065.1 hypothetical protein OL67_002141 [Phaeobacter piscinae]
MFKTKDTDKSLVLEIQLAAMSNEVDVASLLRKAKVAAVKLKQADAVRWIDSELDGYDCGYDDLPDYRKTHGSLKAWNPYRGKIPFMVEDPHTEELITRAPMTDGVGTLQKLVVGAAKNGGLRYNMSTEHRNIVMVIMDIKLEPILTLSTSQLETVLSRVTSLVLNWALELEARGILGEGMTFKPEDTAKATAVTNNIFAQNVGQVGNNSDSANTSISQYSHGDQNIDQRKLYDFLQQAIPASDMLPGDIREEVKRKLVEVRNSDSPEEQGSILQSVKTVLEGASGNLAASGMLQILASVFS